jgi:nucleoside-diphosphate-sugar epimerase
VSWQEADISRIGQVLGWRPKIGLHDSLAELWRTAR